MARFAVFAFVAFLLAFPAGAIAEGKSQAQLQRDQEIREFIDALTKSYDEARHSCIGDKYEKDACLNAGSGITQEDLDRILNPPSS
ncbi:MAG: hypothetical protein VW268_02595 [Rhodospirillaceae bacterium]